MRECCEIQSLPGLRHLKSLRVLDITGCSLIRDLCELSGNVSLEVVRAKGCKNLAELPNMRILVELDIESTTVMLREGEDGGGGGEVEDEEGDDGYPFFYFHPGTGHFGPLFPLWLQDVPEVSTWKNVVRLKAVPVEDESSGKSRSGPMSPMLPSPTGEEKEVGASSASASLLASE